ncbi:MAG: translation initiation factor, partial [Rhodospirillales bacterium]|nr:translation initiation factor [Rhodospirillales bacterium]
MACLPPALGGSAPWALAGWTTLGLLAAFPRRQRDDKDDAVRNGRSGVMLKKIGFGRRMSDHNDQDAAKSRLSLRPSGRLELGKTVDAGSVKQSFSHGRSKTVQVELVKKRVGPAAPNSGPVRTGNAPPMASGSAGPAQVLPRTAGPARASGPRAAGPTPSGGRPLTQNEQANRVRVLEEQRRVEAQRERESRAQQALMVRSAAEEAARKAEDDARRAEEEAEAAEAAARQAERDAAAGIVAAPPKPAEAAPAASATPAGATAARPAATA